MSRQRLYNLDVEEKKKFGLKKVLLCGAKEEQRQSDVLRVSEYSSDDSSLQDDATLNKGLFLSWSFTVDELQSHVL